MKRKSKFLTFILSSLPGLGHIYLGLLQRGLVFLLASAFVVLSGVFCSMLNIFYDGVPFVILPFIWLAAVVDSLILADRINQKFAQYGAAGMDSTQVLQLIEEEMKDQNGKILAVTFSIVPGAGHMYIGQMEKGLQLMAAFFLTLYLSDFLSMSLLLMAAPLLWFYSIFDVMHKVNHPGKQQTPTYFNGIFRDSQLSEKAGKYLGIGLIVVGCLMVLNKIVMPSIVFFLGDQILEYLKTVVIAVLFIVGGVRIMMGSRDKERPEALGGSTDEAVYSSRDAMEAMEKTEFAAKEAEQE
ncbi:MAG: hypothetical protein NC238_17070 [Dehalobacter sp.]|nr:hypothetical protein [Dehalobacter sp.]